MSTEFSIRDHTLFRYTGTEEHVTVPDGVTSIGFHAFADNHTLQTVELPQDLAIIEDCAFHNCVNLRHIDLPAGMQRIGGSAYGAGGAFTGCVNLEEIVLPDGLEYIFSETFQHCGHLKTVHLPNKLRRICIDAFSDCWSLESICIPEGVVRISRSAFSYCTHLKQVEFPDGLEEIWEKAFFGCENLRSVSIPAACRLGDSAFPSHCTVTRRD